MDLIRKIFFSKLNIPYLVIRKIFYVFIKYFGFFSIETIKQANYYSELGLDRTEGLKKLNSILMSNFNNLYSEKHNTYSEHLVLFSSISIANEKILNILEIGTFNGQTALILSKLFPKAKITTIDLPSDNQEFVDTYDRTDSSSKFIRNRNHIIGEQESIEFLEMNSISLALFSNNFDLIWIDGAHGYPTVAMDIINSIRLINKNGFILIDDIFERRVSSDKYYRSIAGYESLEAIKAAGLIDEFSIIPKRLSSKENVPWKQKFIGFIKT